MPLTLCPAPSTPRGPVQHLRNPHNRREPRRRLNVVAQSEGGRRSSVRLSFFDMIVVLGLIYVHAVCACWLVNAIGHDSIVLSLMVNACR